MYIIVNWWYDGSNVAIVTNEDGEAMKFDSEEEAWEYSKELNGHSKVVEL